MPNFNKDFHIEVNGKKYQITISIIKKFHCYFSSNHYTIAFPTAITFRILNTRSPANQLYCKISHVYIYIDLKSPDFHIIRIPNHFIVGWLIIVAAGSVKCGSNNNHYHLLTTHTHTLVYIRIRMI